MKQRIIALFKYLSLIAIGFLFYYKTTTYGFIWDDFQYIQNNPSVQSGSSFFNLWTFNKVNVDFWPLSYSLIWIINTVFGGSTYAFHLTNLSLFLLSAILIYSILKELKINLTYIISLIYIIHPFNTVLAIWSFQLKTNLANVLALMSFIALIHYTKGSFKNKLFYIGSLFFFLLSLLAKTHLILLPIVYVLYFMLLYKENLKNCLIKTSPFFLISLVIGIVNIHWDNNSLPTPPSETIISESIYERLVQASHNFFFYLKNSLLPSQLSFNHPKHSINILNVFDLSLFLILIIFLSFFLYSIYTKKKIKTTYSCLFIGFILIFPALGFFEIYYFRFSNVAEHYLNLSLIPLLLAAIPLFDSIKNKYIQLALILSYIGYLSFRTFNYIPYFSDEKTLLSYTISQNPESFLSYNILGSSYKLNGDLNTALSYYKKSLDIQETAQTHFNMATVYEAMNLLDQARSHYESAEALNPYFSQININLGGLYTKLKNQKVAIENFEKAISKDPFNPIPYYNIGYLYETNNDLNSALTWYTKSYNLSPNTTLFRDSFLRLKRSLNTNE